MDAKLPTPFTLLLSVAMVLMLGALRVAMGAEAYATDDEASSAVFISDDASANSYDAPPTASGSLVMVGDLPDTQPIAIKQPVTLPVAIQFQTPTQQNQSSLEALPQESPSSIAFRSDMSVVTNNQKQQTKLEAIRPASTASVSDYQPVAEPTAQPAPLSQPGDIANAVHAEPLAQQTDNKSAAQLLISAHKLSLTATTEADYTRILQDCAEALYQDQQQSVQADQREFANTLASWALNRRGQWFSDEGSNELADADFQAALELNSQNWRALHNRGVSFAQTGQFAEAFDDFNGVIGLNPSYAKAYVNRATLYVQANDLQSAMKDYELAIERDNNFGTAHVGLGRVCHMLGRWEEALEHFTAAVNASPTDPEIICSRGDLQADMGHYADALADYAQTIELDPEFAHAYRNGAWLLATCPDERYRDPQNAVIGAQQALEYGYGERHIALDTLAAALASNGQFEEAVATVTEAVDLAPEATKYTYLSRRQLYQEGEPFRTDPVGDIAQAQYQE